MNGTRELLRLLQCEPTWTVANRSLRLRWAKGRLGSMLDVLLPQRIFGSEAIDGGIEYHIAALAGTPTLPLKELIALPIEIQFATDRGQLRRVCGIIDEARVGDSDGGLTAYYLIMRDALAIMEKRTNSRIFRYKNELEIVQVLCDEWRHSNSVLASAFEIELDPLFDMAKFPPREQTMQYNESDAAFVRRILKRRGISSFIRPGRCRTSAIDSSHDDTPAHTLVLFDGATNSLRRNAAGTVRYHREDATEERDVITSFTGIRRLQPGKATRFSPDYKNPGNAEFLTASARGSSDQGSYGNELATTLDDYVVDIPHVGNDIQDQQCLNVLRVRRHEFETKCFLGEGCVRDFCQGEYFVLEGHPEIDTHPPPEREFVLIELELEARNNLPKDLHARADRLFASGRLRDAGMPAGQDDLDRPGAVRVRFKAVRRGVPIVPAFDPRADLPHPQMQSAIVVGPAGEDVYCDALGRVKIHFPGMRAADHAHAQGAGASDGPADSAWVRVASNWAGNGPSARHQSGTLGLPRVGTEVLVAFLGGDPDRPIILSQLYNSRTMPPTFNGVGSLPGNRYVSGTRTRETQGRRGNQLRFDDTHGQISAQLASDHGTSELNLGWLTRPRADGQAEPRGEGAELRSDEAVAIRGGKGVLLTAAASPHAEGTQLGRAGLVGLADLLQGVVDEVGRLAEHHAGDESTGRLADLAGKLRHWHEGSNLAPGSRDGGAPIVAVTAEAGIVLASPDSVALGSEKKVTVASAGDAEVTAGRNIFVRAARGLSMFAHELGMKFVAARGNVSVQAHQGNIEIKSSGRISIIAAEGIDFQAPEIKLVAQGAQTDLGKGGIVQHCAEKYVVKAAQSVRVGPGGGTPAGLKLPVSQIRTDEHVILRDRHTHEPLPRQRYIAHLEDGRTFDGITDELGRTALTKADALGQVRFDLILPAQPA
jgi:type VI secretion system secreted protein VgrG